MNLIAYRNAGSDLIHLCWREVGRETEKLASVEGREVLRVVERPINWTDMGSSARDLWEERAMRGVAAH